MDDEEGAAVAAEDEEAEAETAVVATKTGMYSELFSLQRSANPSQAIRRAP